MLDAEPVLDLLEELGIAVVDDLLCHESMQFRTPTRSVGTVESKLAYRFLDLKGRPPCMSPRSPEGCCWPSWQRSARRTLSCFP